MEKLKNLYRSYKHGLFALGYMVIYMVWFVYLEKTVTRNFTVIHTALDDYIPFCEVFVIPYFLWFAYVAGTVIFLMIKNKEEYFKACVFLFTGMTIFLVISTLWPNGQHLRPFVMPRDNIFTRMVAGLYRTDTPTNLWPSIHVFNSIGAHIALSKSESLREHKGIRIGSLILAISIILSTMFIKQHSTFDVATAFIMAGILYVLVYRTELVANFVRSVHTSRASRSRRNKRTPQIN